MRLVFFVVYLVATIGAVSLDLTSLTQYDANAVCNDGSPAGVYFKAATDPSQAHIWLYFFQGGSWCYDQASCAERWQHARHLMSSNDWSSTHDEAGIFSSESPLGGANLAYLAYCSSDAHMGNRAASNETFGYHFRGATILRAGLAFLKDQGLGSSKHLLLVGGASAGGRGAMAALDFISGYVASDQVLVLGVLDSPYWVDKAPYSSSSFIGFAAVTSKVYQLANATTHIPDDCRAFYSSQPWKCLFGQYRMPFLRTPYLVYASQFDHYQIDNNVGSAPFDNGQTNYINNLASTTRSLLQALPPVSSPLRNVSGVYSSTCFNHAVSCTPTFFKETVNGNSMSDALQAFLQPYLSFSNKPIKASIGTPVRVIDDSCLTLDCGSGCP
eukprot:TRINITY_DN1398_c0_g1_i2.p1 TRINITY_DN1398_c0_g1~~TRINITY_DN1398_c0_g1_i2.p1  ORF type:complete len:385 (-),score=74.53 TRINITY_DN1398_c0_g1_i2:74-1228(-)